MQTPLDELLAPFGAGAEDVLTLDGELRGVDRLDYADLIKYAPANLRPDGVVRLRGVTVAYVLRGGTGPVDPHRIVRMRRMLALRDDAPFLVVVSPGRLAIYGVGLDRLAADASWLGDVEASEALAPSTFRRLHQRQPEYESAVHDQIFRLLTTAIDGLTSQGVAHLDAISLAGRALLIRFLLDRDVIGGRRKAAGEIAPGAQDWEALFANATRSQQTCSWIDSTFNGDFLPVSIEAFRHLSHQTSYLLVEIVRRTPQGELDLGAIRTDLDTPFSWGELNFAHIPVGTLSQVYENQVERWRSNTRRGDSVYYTPRRIAEYLVREAFQRLEDQQRAPAWDARVLDPAVGGGVFLIAAYREKAAAYERTFGKWPTSRVLRRMLFEQLCGYDIQDEALSFTSLSLYLTAFELDQPPYDFADLKFDRALRRTSLFDVSGAEPASSPGSLGPAVPAEHLGRFDLVVANPPWTSVPGPRGANVRRAALESTRPLVAERLGQARADHFDYPDNIPDLPFVWRAMQWARPGGVLAFALHARLLHKSTPQGQQARLDLFGAISVWGMVDGTDLRNTPVWPGVAAPFCLILADNVVPSPDHAFHVSSPHFEPGLNAKGRLRIDPDAIEPVSLARLAESPMILKVLLRGTALDLHLLERLQRRAWPTLSEWMDAHGLMLKQGYQVAGQRNDASAMHGLRRLDAKGVLPDLVIDSARLPHFANSVLHRPRSIEIYQGPLVLVRKAMPVREWRLHVSPVGLAFNESFFGLSLSSHPDGLLVAHYLAVLLQSPLFEWFNLVTGGEYGVEREAMLKADIEQFPVVPFEHLDANQRGEVRDLFTRLAAGTLGPNHLAAWTTALYQLGAHAAEVVMDTLQMSRPFTKNKEEAAGPPEATMVRAFAERLAERLRPFANVQVRVVPTVERDPYRLVVIGSEVPEAALDARWVSRVLEAADRLGSSEWLVRDEARGLVWLGRLAQRRYWTLSRARLTAARLVSEGAIQAWT